MVEVQTHSSSLPASTKTMERTASVTVPSSSIGIPPQTQAARLRGRIVLDTFSPVNQNGSFEFDRVIKSGYVQKRTQKTKVRSCAPAPWLPPLSARSNLYARPGSRFS